MNLQDLVTLIDATQGTLPAALACAARGWHVFPCGPDKRPLTPHGFKNAVSNASAVRRLWKAHPAAIIGVATGASGLVVIDLDVKNGQRGLDEWHALVQELGKDLENTTIIDTPSGGAHVYYRANGHRVSSTVKRLAPGIDTRAEGGYVIAAGSPGYLYVEGHGPERLAVLPPALGKRLAYAVAKPAEAKQAGAKIPEGQRDNTLTSLAGTMRRRGISEDGIHAALAVENKANCQPPLPDSQVRKIARSIGSKEPAAPSGDAPKPARHARVVRMADVAAQAITWLWPGRIPEGKIALLIGDPGMGKTMLALDIVARVSRGAAFPDGTRAPAGDVVILTAEDGIADTIRPRLDAAGADVARVWVLKSVTTDEVDGRLFSLADDVDVLEDVVSEHRARLVMIDPLDAYLRGVDSHRNSEVRGVLAPWATLLERMSATGLGVHHLNKDSSTVNALYRAGGSLAFVAAARAVFGVAPDPECEGRSLFLPIKLNIAAKPPGIGYRVTDHGIAWDSDPVTCDAAVAFGGPRKADSDLVSAARDFLADALEDGQYVPQVALEEAAAELGIAPKSLNKAKQALGVESKREGFGAGGLWFWRLSTA